MELIATGRWSRSMKRWGVVVAFRAERPSDKRRAPKLPPVMRALSQPPPQGGPQGLSFTYGSPAPPFVSPRTSVHQPDFESRALNPSQAAAPTDDVC
jgi:hypothetical protein